MEHNYGHDISLYAQVLPTLAVEWVILRLLEIIPRILPTTQMGDLFMCNRNKNMYSLSWFKFYALRYE